MSFTFDRQTNVDLQPGRNFRAFMSYNHRADLRFAAPLQQALRGFARPWYYFRPKDIYRDQTFMYSDVYAWTADHTDIGSVGEWAMDESEKLLLFASPGGAASAWVNREVEYWLSRRSADSIVVVHTDGEIACNETTGDFDPRRTTAIPPALLPVPGPYRVIDLRPAIPNVGGLALETPDGMHAVAEIAAALDGSSAEQLSRRDRRTGRLHKFTARGLAVGLALVILGLLVDLITRPLQEVGVFPDLAPIRSVRSGLENVALIANLVAAWAALAWVSVAFARNAGQLRSLGVRTPVGFLAAAFRRPRLGVRAPGDPGDRHAGDAVSVDISMSALRGVRDVRVALVLQREYLGWEDANSQPPPKQRVPLQTLRKFGQTALRVATLRWLFESLNLLEPKRRRRWRTDRFYASPRVIWTHGEPEGERTANFNIPQQAVPTYAGVATTNHWYIEVGATRPMLRDRRIKLPVVVATEPMVGGVVLDATEPGLKLDPTLPFPGKDWTTVARGPGELSESITDAELVGVETVISEVGWVERRRRPVGAVLDRTRADGDPSVRIKAHVPSGAALAHRTVRFDGVVNTEVTWELRLKRGGSAEGARSDVVFVMGAQRSEAEGASDRGRPSELRADVGANRRLSFGSVKQLLRSLAGRRRPPRLFDSASVPGGGSSADVTPPAVRLIRAILRFIYVVLPSFLRWVIAAVLVVLLLLLPQSQGLAFWPLTVGGGLLIVTAALGLGWRRMRLRAPSQRRLGARWGWPVSTVAACGVFVVAMLYPWGAQPSEQEHSTDSGVSSVAANSTVHTTDPAVEIARFAYRAAGSAELSQANPAQRALRDTLAAQQYVCVRDPVCVEFA